MRLSPVFALAALLAQAQAPSSESVTADALRGRVSYLASNLLEGRDTPSRGLDRAAAYIASEFQRAGLNNAPGVTGFFQNADYDLITRSREPVEFSLSGASAVSPSRIEVLSLKGVSLTSEPVFKWTPKVSVDIPLAGKILMLRAPGDPEIVAKLAFSRPDAIVLLMHNSAQRTPPESRLLLASRGPENGPAIVSLPEVDLESAFERLPAGLTSAQASLSIPSPRITRTTLHNVIGVLPGSDPELRSQYLLVSAHYDHLGMSETEGIFNGANDDASGVATVIELAAALARENPQPRRTIVFVCFFGEEKGLLGSTWYVRHPVFPLAQTIADINLEQLGEPAGDEGAKTGSLGATGYDYSDLPRMLAPDFAQSGVELRDLRHNAQFFERSDNFCFAQAGIPAHTFVAALEYPDYHRPTDKWQKLNYENMAKLERSLAAAILHLANTSVVPRWNPRSKAAKEFLDAWRALHPM